MSSMKDFADKYLGAGHEWRRGPIVSLKDRDFVCIECGKMLTVYTFTPSKPLLDALDYVREYNPETDYQPHLAAKERG